jgi:hypothetical protein
MIEFPQEAYNDPDNAASLLNGKQQEIDWLKLAVNEARYQEGLLRSEVVHTLKLIIEYFELGLSPSPDDRYDLSMGIGFLNDLINGLEPKNG